MYRVYGDRLSGNCYKIKLIMSLLGIEHVWQEVDILSGATRTTNFMNINANAKIPVLQINESEYLWESNAILNYLAENSAFLPSQGIERAKVLQWQFFEQYSHEPYIAVARYINTYLGLPKEKLNEYQSKQAGGHKALKVMEGQLLATPFLTGEIPTIADISLYAYTHVADEGGFSLTNYPSIQRWLSDIENLSGYVAM